MNPYNRCKKDTQLYFAGQWAEAGVYRCLDPCPLGQGEVVLVEDGFLPDPTGGWVGRFVRVRNQRVTKCEASSMRTPKAKRATGQMCVGFVKYVKGGDN